ncbi:hypothetical protein KAU33_11355 [Candidatus Dependentiae bacterium]|nr:hypothetical protein [Candidatus Dependentiae bacterium]
MEKIKETDIKVIKPVYTNSVLMFSLLCAFIPFGYGVLIIVIIIRIIHHNSLLKKDLPEDQIEILKRNTKIYIYSFSICLIPGILITLFLFDTFGFRDSLWVFGTLFFLFVATIFLSLIEVIFHFEKRKKYSGNIFLILNSFILISVMTIAVCVAIPNMVEGPRKPKISRCSGNLRNLGIIVTNYSTDHNGHYPQNLKVLVELGYIEELPTCSIKNKPYLYSIDGWDDDDFTVWCPNPEKHVGTSGPKSTTASLYYHAGEGVIQEDK